jgi:hypothetical protein
MEEVQNFSHLKLWTINFNYIKIKKFNEWNVADVQKYITILIQPSTQDIQLNICVTP